MKGFVLKLMFISGLFLFISCDIMKKSAKSKESLDINYQEETKTTRLGDTVKYTIPKITYRDTIIYTTNRQGTTLMTTYDANGNIATIECQASKIEELSRRNLQLEQDNKNKQSEKTENFDSTFILYIVLGVVILGVFGMILLFILINKNTKAITTVLNNLPK